MARPGAVADGVPDVEAVALVEVAACRGRSFGDPVARSLAAEDDRVDALEDQVIAELISAARQNPVRLDCAIFMLDIAHTLERLADRTTNIAERVIFITTNMMEELNS